MRLIFSCLKKMRRIWAQSKIEACRNFFVCEACRRNKSVGLVMSVFIVAQVKCPRAFAPLRALIAGHPGLIAIS